MKITPFSSMLVSLCFINMTGENTFDHYYTYYLDRECSQILLKVCGDGDQTLLWKDDYFYWSDDYVEIADRLYAEAHE